MLLAMKNMFFFSLVMLLTIQASAQVNFVEAGKVYFEKRVNQYQLLDIDHDNEWAQLMKKNMPKITVNNYLLTFNKQHSLYQLIKENDDTKYIFGMKPSANDKIWIDLSNNSITMQRDVFEQTYLLQDSLRKLEWKITGETREIAGFECKKAVTKICDSVYVVAFYTDQIPVSSGPESFSGLPGLILGLAVPRLYTTWFATKLELTAPNASVAAPKLKGKLTNWQSLQKDLNKGMSDWGKSGPKYVWNALL
ncbi:GLPGLI family protein [Hydrotalea sp.]|uniref:GLPGLI family protein n=1 Tax=Hydrotalea sp. TaxID=2881279 RepID=UPI0026346003|nr:GLPGLI family protein [Hydrotalea sp.]